MAGAVAGEAAVRRLADRADPAEDVARKEHPVDLVKLPQPLDGARKAAELELPLVAADEECSAARAA